MALVWKEKYVMYIGYKNPQNRSGLFKLFYHEMRKSYRRTDTMNLN